MESKNKFIPTVKKGYSIKNGMLYEFKRNSVNVSRPWPPCKYTKTSKKPFWHYSPTHGITLHFTALRYSVEMEKGMRADDSRQMADDSRERGENSSEVAKITDDKRKIVEDAFWQRYELPAVHLLKDEHLQKTLANQRKWTPVIASFYDKIPFNAREMMLANTEGAWNICALYARCPGAEELMKNYPAIGFMLSNFPVFRPKLKRKWDGVRRIISKPRRRILAWLGWPDSEAVAKILSKIQYPACDKTSLLMLRSLLKKNPELIKPMSHLKIINAPALSVICRNSYRKHSSWRFINELGLMNAAINDNMDSKAHGIQRMFIDTLSMEKMLLLSHGPIRSIAHLGKRHQRAIDEVNRHEISDLEKSEDFPCPPVPVPAPRDDFEIYPLDTPLKLYKEAKEQHNCVFACYRERVAKSEGNVYVYSMNKPERATVAVEFDNESRTFFPGEVKGPSNKDVSNDTISKIIIWLSKMGKKHPPLYLDENSPDRILPAFPVPIPKPDEKFMVSQIISLKSLISGMEQYNLSPEPNIMSQIEQGRSFAFLMDSPDKAFVFVTKDKGGTFTYAGFKKIRISALNHDAERLLEEWMEAATIMNLSTCNPDQMDFEFSAIEQFVRFLPQASTEDKMA